MTTESQRGASTAQRDDSRILALTQQLEVERARRLAAEQDAQRLGVLAEVSERFATSLDPVESLRLLAELTRAQAGTVVRHLPQRPARHDERGHRAPSGRS